MVAVGSVNVERAAERAAPARKRIVPADLLASVAPGTTREDLLSRLGEPSSRYSITGDEGVRESFV